MKLVQNIMGAFSERDYPGDDHLLLPVDDEGEGQLFVGMNWRDLDYEKLELRTFVLHCFTPDAFCYFLPAYLVACTEKPDSGLSDVVLERISPPKNDTTRPSFSEWWEKLSSSQKHVIMEVVKFHEARGTIMRPGIVKAFEHACET